MDSSQSPGAWDTGGHCQREQGEVVGTCVCSAGAWDPHCGLGGGRQWRAKACEARDGTGLGGWGLNAGFRHPRHYPQRLNSYI